MDWLRRLATDPHITPFGVRVAVALTHYFNRESGVAFPSHASLAAGASGTERGVRAAMRSLEAIGYLKVERIGRRATNRYLPSFPQGDDRHGDDGHLVDDRHGDDGHLVDDRHGDDGHPVDNRAPECGDRHGHDGVTVMAMTANPLIEPFKKESGGTAFTDRASAVAAVIDAVGLAEGSATLAELLRGSRFDRGCFLVKTASQWRAIRDCAGEAIDALGLQVACR